jgi:hypothetical protein
MNTDVIHNNDSCWRIGGVISEKMEVKNSNKREELEFNIIYAKLPLSQSFVYQESGVNLHEDNAFKRGYHFIRYFIHLM